MDKKKIGWVLVVIGILGLLWGWWSYNLVVMVIGALVAIIGLWFAFKKEGTMQPPQSSQRPM